MSSDYRAMWQKLGLDMQGHDALLGVLAVIYGVDALCLPIISHVDPIHMRDVPWMRDTNTVYARQRVGSALVIGSARNERCSKS